jgi:hypothetical protein
MTKAAREAAFDEERNDALRRSVGLVLPRQERRSSLAPLHSHVVVQASLGRLEALPVHELTLEQRERDERPERLRAQGTTVRCSRFPPRCRFRQPRTRNPPAARGMTASMSPSGRRAAAGQAAALLQRLVRYPVPVGRIRLVA